MTANHTNTLTTVVSYPERGEGGNNRYRGNCSPKLFEDLIAHFGIQDICDYMCGSNTTGDAARTMGITLDRSIKKIAIWIITTKPHTQPTNCIVLPM